MPPRPGPQYPHYDDSRSGQVAATPAHGAGGSAGLVLTCRIAAVVLVALGLSIPFDNTCGWASATAWSVFAMLAAIVQLLPAFAGAFGWTRARAWLISAVGTGSLLVFWLLIALPGIAGNDGFCLTVAAAAAAAGCALAPGRRW